MLWSTLVYWLQALSMVVLLAAFSCARSPAPVADQQQMVTVSGKALLEAASGEDVALKQTQIEAIAAADEAVLFSTWSDADGNYTVVVPADTEFSLRASSRADSGDSSGWSVTVEAAAGDLFHADDGPATAGATGLRDLYIEGAEAAPFALLEQLQSAYDSARELWPEGVWPPLAAVVDDNADAAYRLDTQGLLPTLTLPKADGAAAVRGFARYLQFYAFRDERPLHEEAVDDPRTVFSNAFGAALANFLLTQQPLLEPQPALTPLTELIDDIFQDRGAVGLTASEVSELLNAPELVEFDGVMTAHAFLAAVRQLHPDRAAAIDTRALPLGIGSDAFGADLLNAAEPLYVPLGVGETITLCGGSLPGAPGANGHRLARLQLPESGRYQLSAIDAGSAMPHTNPEMILFRAGEPSLAGYSQQARMEVVEHSLTAGNYVLDVFDRGNADGNALTGGRACFAVALQATDPFAAPSPTPACDNLASLAGDTKCRSAEELGASVGF